MSILGGNGSMNGPIFHEFKKQASFFLKEKIKTARLALTDVTPAQLLAEEATNGNPEGPDARTLKMISKAAFEVDDYWRIVDILHKRLVRFEKGNWRVSYKALIVLEHLLTHGPERVAEEFQSDRDVIKQMENFHHIDDKGFNWGVNVRRKSERIVKLLEKGPLFKQERDKTRKVSRGIQGFGSFCIRTPSPSSDHQESSLKSLHRCNSDSTHHADQEDLFPISKSETKTEEKPLPLANKKVMNPSTGSFIAHFDSKENMAPRKGLLEKEGSLDSTGEGKPLLTEKRNDSGTKTSIKNHHPFEESKHLSAISLLSGADELQAY